MNKTYKNEVVVNLVNTSSKEYLSCKDLCENELAIRDGEGILSLEAIDNSDLLFSLKHENEIVGYVGLSKMNQKKIGTLDKLYNNATQISEGFYIEQILIKKDYQGNGLANTLLENKLIRNLTQGMDLYAHVSVKNKNSLIFFLKNNFTPIGTYQNTDFYGIKNYSSLLLKKERSY